MSPREASDLLPVVVIFWCTVMTGVLVLTYRWMAKASRRWRGNRRRNPVPLRVRLRESWRLARLRLTGRWPRYYGGNEGGRALDERELRVLGRVARAEKRRQPLAGDPHCERRLP